jgi:hypothetical protein
MAALVSTVRRLLLPSVLAAAGGCGALQAQVTAGASPGLNAALVRLLGDHRAFTARLDLKIVDAQGKVVLSAPMAFSTLNGSMRGDMDVSRLESKDLPALAASAARSVGMNEVITLVRPDKQETYLLYPAFSACIVAPIDPEDVEALKKPAAIQKTPLQRETLDGHPCVKNRVVVTEPDGRHHEATVWEAEDMNRFPLRIQTVDDTDTITLNFRQVKFQAPRAADFDLPAGTARYADSQELSQAILKKLLHEVLGGGGKD